MTQYMTDEELAHPAEQRGREPGFECAARKQGTAGGNDPADCDWPHCGCDPYANKVMEVLNETDAALDRARSEGGAEGMERAAKIAEADAAKCREKASSITSEMRRDLWLSCADTGRQIAAAIRGAIP